MLSPDLQKINHIRDYCLEIAQTIKRYGDSFEVFSIDTDYQKSISFSIMQIGELSSGLSAEYRENTSEFIPWSSIRGMRNLFAHNYGSMSREIIWKTAKEDVPKLLAFTEKALAEPEKESVLTILKRVKGNGEQRNPKGKKRDTDIDIEP